MYECAVVLPGAHSAIERDYAFKLTGFGRWHLFIQEGEGQDDTWVVRTERVYHL
jgi:hypothetical protein